MSDEAERQAVEADCWITVGSHSQRHNLDSNRNTNTTTTTTSFADCSKPQEKAFPITASGSYFQVLADEDDDDDDEEEEHPPTCPICIELVNVIRGRLECSHVFCFACVEEWCKRESSCPLCRHQVTSIVKLDANQSLVDGETTPLAPRMRSSFEYVSLTFVSLRDFSYHHHHIMISYSWNHLTFDREQVPEVTSTASVLTDMNILEPPRDEVDVITGGSKCISNTTRDGWLLKLGRSSSSEGIT